MSASTIAPARPRPRPAQTLKPYIRLAANGQPAPGGGPTPWTLPALCAAYAWPTNCPGGGTIALVECGGGWSAADVASYFALIGQPAPVLTDISVDGTQNNFGADPDADGEVALDLQIAAGAYSLATGRPATLRIYWSTDIADAVAAAARDGCAVCSISWGADEAVWGPCKARRMARIAEAATEAGMTLFAASGDNDAADGGPSPANVDLPSSCPHIIGCGGTRKTPEAETVWNTSPGRPNGHGTGGGFSSLFPRPAWQPASGQGRGRMVPDVSANADPATGYEIVLNGTRQVVGGTSAVAPLYAGLFAAFGPGRGFITDRLYQAPSCFTDITEGDNGTFHANPGPPAGAVRPQTPEGVSPRGPGPHGPGGVQGRSPWPS